MASTLDNVSEGRLDFGVGAGGMNRAETQKSLGYEYEFEAYGIPFPENSTTRIKILDEGLEIARRMWTQNMASYQGEHYTIKNAICLPKPVQKPYPPIWIGGGSGKKILHIVAKHADGWNLMGVSSVEDYHHWIEKLEKACKEVGRNINEIKTSVVIKDFSSVKECKRKLELFEKGGLNLALLNIIQGKEDEYLNNLN